MQGQHGDEVYDITLDHMQHPRNYGKLPDADATGIGKNPENGEMVIVYLKMDGDTVAEIAFQAKACMTTVIAGSIFTDTVKGTTKEEAKALTAIMLSKIDRMPPEEAACTELVGEAFYAALDHLEAKKADGDAPVPTRMVTRRCDPEAVEKKYTEGQ